MVSNASTLDGVANEALMIPYVTGTRKKTTVAKMGSTMVQMGAVVTGQIAVDDDATEVFRVT
jgi:hypothetical protein